MAEDFERASRGGANPHHSTYNNERPNMGIGGITLAMKLKTAA
jgi:hypothetical protein